MDVEEKEQMEEEKDTMEKEGEDDPLLH